MTDLIWEELANIAERVILEKPKFQCIEKIFFDCKKICKYQEPPNQNITCIGQCKLHINSKSLDFISCTKCKLRQIPCNFENCICLGFGMLIRTTSDSYFRHQIPGESCSILIPFSSDCINDILYHYTTFHV